MYLSKTLSTTCSILYPESKNVRNSIVLYSGHIFSSISPIRVNIIAYLCNKCIYIIYTYIIYIVYIYIRVRENYTHLCLRVVCTRVLLYVEWYVNCNERTNKTDTSNWNFRCWRKTCNITLSHLELWRVQRSSKPFVFDHISCRLCAVNPAGPWICEFVLGEIVFVFVSVRTRSHSAGRWKTWSFRANGSVWFALRPVVFCT